MLREAYGGLDLETGHAAELAGRQRLDPARPLRAAHADLPRCLHAARRDPLRAVHPFRREGDRLSFVAPGRDRRSVRRGRRQPSRSHLPEPGAAVLSDLRTEPPAAFRHPDRAVTPCPTLADGGASPVGRRCCPRPCLAWPPGVEAGLEVSLLKLSSEDFGDLANARAILPIRIAEPLSALIVHGSRRVPGASGGGRTLRCDTIAVLDVRRVRSVRTRSRDLSRGQSQRHLQPRLIVSCGIRGAGVPRGPSFPARLDVDAENRVRNLVDGCLLGSRQLLDERQRDRAPTLGRLTAREPCDVDVAH